MTWRSEKYKRAAAKRKSKSDLVKWLRPAASTFAQEFPGIFITEAQTHTQAHMRAKEGLAGLNARTSGEGQ